MKRDFVLLKLDNDKDNMNFLCEARKNFMSNLKSRKSYENTSYREVVTGEIIKPSDSKSKNCLTYSSKPVSISNDQAFLLWARIRDLGLTTYISHIYEVKNSLLQEDVKRKVLK